MFGSRLYSNSTQSISIFIAQHHRSSYYSENGCLAFGQQGILRFHEKMTANGVESQLMSGKEVNEKYPNQLKLPDDYNCFFAKNNGLIRASHALATLQVRDIYDSNCFNSTCL